MPGSPISETWGNVKEMGAFSMKIKSRRDGIYAGHEAEVGTFLSTI